MKNRLLGFAALGFLLIAFVLAFAPVVRAQGVDDKIQTLEQELGRLKSEQMELKKEATAAAAALPSFSYRPGNGVAIEAADKAWKLQLSHETHWMMPFNEGKDRGGRTQGEVMGRRFRQEWTLCLNNCFYTWISRHDMDGFGTNTQLQRGMFEVHWEQVNPWLPTFYIGMDIPARVAPPFRQGSGATGAQMEYDLLSRNNGINTGRTGTGWGVVWEELPIGNIIPGRADLNFVVGSQGAADDGASVGMNKKDYMLYFRIDPFSRVKNPWISGFSFAIGNVFAHNDSGTVSCCSRNRLQDHGPSGRQTLFDSGAAAITDGMQHWVNPGIQWRYGPYSLRAVMGFMNYNDANDNIGVDQKARNFLIAHDIFVWSPKGALTGSPSAPGSVLFGYHFERNDYSCSHTRANAMCAAGAEFSRNRVILNEWDLWYFFMPGKSLGISWLWYDASNLRSGAGNAQATLLDKSPGQTVAGRGGDWLDVILGLRVNF